MIIPVTGTDLIPRSSTIRSTADTTLAPEEVRLTCE